MSTILPIDAIATPRRLVLDPPMTDAELFEFCVQNDSLRVERTREGVIEMNAPAGGESSSANVDIFYHLFAWWRVHKRGCVYDSMLAFICPMARCSARMAPTLQLRAG